MKIKEKQLKRVLVNDSTIKVDKTTQKDVKLVLYTFGRYGSKDRQYSLILLRGDNYSCTLCDHVKRINTINKYSYIFGIEFVIAHFSHPEVN